MKTRFINIPEIFAALFFLLPVLFTVWLDSVLKPEVHSVQDEGIYIGMLAVGFGIELAFIQIVIWCIDLIRFMRKKLKIRQ